MKPVISETDLIRGAAIFLLTVPPYTELHEDVAGIAKSFREGRLEHSAALAFMEQTKSKKISEWIKTNQELDQELGSWTKI